MSAKKKLIFIFLDGVGIGPNIDKNPLYKVQAEYLPFYHGALSLPDGTPVKSIDANLGVAGLPQSGSGQTTLYTGVNIPQMIGEHKSSYPTRAMRKQILEKNILSKLKQNGLDAVFINAYPIYSRLFREPHIQIKPNGEFHFSPAFPRLFRRRVSATSCMMVASGQPAFNEDDILAEESVFQEYTNRWLNEKGLKLPEFSPEKAAEIIFNASLKRDFLLYEYFQTDLYAHRHSFEDQLRLIEDLNRLLEKLFSLMDPETHTFLLTSDHGNLEDHTTRSHTRNPVPLVVWGKDSEPLRDTIDDLSHVTPAIVSFFN
jgi:2,3-bisphosphoglycerate-independent phosphoglycerate mutase